MTHHRVVLELLDALDQILPHQVLGEGEGAQHHFVGDLETVHLEHLAAHAGEDAGDVEAMFVAGQQGIEALDVEVEVLAQHLQQGGVEARLVVAEGQADARADRLAGQGHRQQDQRRAVGAILDARALPAQEADGEEQGIGAAFLQVGAGAAVQLDQGGVELVRLQRGEQTALGQRGERGLRQRGGVLGGIAFAGRALGLRVDGETLAAGQQILQRRRIGGQQRDGDLAVAQAEQRVAQGQVEQAALPLLQPAAGAGGQFVVVRRGNRGQLRGVEHLRIGGRLAGLAIQRTDLRGARLGDVEDQHEARVVVQALLGDADRLLERRALAEQAGIEQQHLAQLHALAQGQRILAADARKEALGAEPQADVGVLLLQHDERMQADALEQRGEQQRAIEGAGAAALDDLRRAAQALRLGQWRRRRQGVEAQAEQHVPQRRRLQAEARSVGSGVAMQAGVVAVALEQLAGQLQQLVHHRLAGQAEGRQTLGGLAVALPGVALRRGDVRYRRFPLRGGALLATGLRRE